MADAVLQHLAALGYEVEGLARYLRHKMLVRGREAEAHIAALLRERAARDGGPVQATLDASGVETLL